jgi:hypothetical protein
LRLTRSRKMNACCQVISELRSLPEVGSKPGDRSITFRIIPKNFKPGPDRRMLHAFICIIIRWWIIRWRGIHQAKLFSFSFRSRLACRYVGFQVFMIIPYFMMAKVLLGYMDIQGERNPFSVFIDRCRPAARVVSVRKYVYVSSTLWFNTSCLNRWACGGHWAVART